MVEVTAALEKNDSLFADGIGGGEVAIQNNFFQIIDSWEDQDVAEYSGDTASFSIDTSANGHLVTDGSYGLGANSDLGNISIASTSGLNTYPSQGQTWKCDVYTPDSFGAQRVGYFLQSGIAAPDGYFTTIVPSTGLRIQKRSGGVLSTLTESTWDPSGQTEYTIETTPFSDGTIRVRAFDSTGTEQTEITATDTDFSSGGIGFEYNPDTTSVSAYWDYYRVV